MKTPTRSGTTIVTLTMNPALDITTDTDRVIPTDKMRCGPPRYDPGGGGINVARIAHVLGASASALFPAGGHAGEKVTTLVAESGAARDAELRSVPLTLAHVFPATVGTWLASSLAVDS